MIGVLINSGAAWAAAAMTAGVPEWQAAITGQASIADHFAATVRQYLDAAEVEDGFADVAYANFGVYGEFTFVVVHLSDALVFMDPLTGNLLGPLEPGSALDAPPLLIEHPDAYEDGMGVRYYNEFGCTVSALGKWRADTQTPWTPPVAPPPATVPGPFVPVIRPGRLPGVPTPWNCHVDALSRCICTTDYTYVPPPGTPCPLPGEATGRCGLKLRITCTSAPGYMAPGLGNQCNGGPNTSPAPVPGPGGNPPPGILPEPTPPTTPPGTSPDFTAPGSGCSITYWYWT